MTSFSTSNARLRELLRRIAATRPEEIDCEELFETLAILIDQVERREDLQPDIDAVRQHLEMCPRCLAELQPLLAAMERTEL